MPLRRIAATRYVTPLREGGSLPAVVEAEDDGLYVLKFRGAGQGRKALVAELLAGEIARAAELPVPEIVLMELDAGLARTEPDPEIQGLIGASAGLNLALDYLPGAAGFDPVVDRVDVELASAIVWFDAYVMNVDRTARNTNLLVWHGRLHLIDHGAALYFHHDWAGHGRRSAEPFERVRDHVLLPMAGALQPADAMLRARLTRQTLEAIVGMVPDEWLAGEPGFAAPDEVRSAYARWLLDRLSSHAFLEEALRARSSL